MVAYQPFDCQASDIRGVTLIGTAALVLLLLPYTPPFLSPTSIAPMIEQPLGGSHSNTRTRPSSSRLSIRFFVGIPTTMSQERPGRMGSSGMTPERHTRLGTGGNGAAGCGGGGGQALGAGNALRTKTSWSSEGMASSPVRQWHENGAFLRVLQPCPDVYPSRCIHQQR